MIFAKQKDIEVIPYSDADPSGFGSGEELFLLLEKYIYPSWVGISQQLKRIYCKSYVALKVAKFLIWT